MKQSRSSRLEEETTIYREKDKLRKTTARSSRTDEEVVCEQENAKLRMKKNRISRAKESWLLDKKKDASRKKLQPYNSVYSNICVNDKWLSDSEDTSSILNQLTMENNEIVNNENEIVTDSEDEIEEAALLEIQEHLAHSRSMNNETCLQSQDGNKIQASDVINIAPGEGQVPVSTFREPEWEAIAFPKLFHDGKHTYNTTRSVKLTTKKYINVRLLNIDGQFGECTEYIFQSLHWLETLQLQSIINISQHPGILSHIINDEQLFTSFKSLRGTPLYWQQMQLDMLEKLRQLCPYTFFVATSAAEFQWTKVISVVAKQYGQQFSKDQMSAMDWETKKLVKTECCKSCKAN
ncbi:hypothetical protein KUTeg_012310 [Tegillarca granosa]|uniref:Uncharacterized protein n=1 Tax=Tegillarca granosa TaxID=220873 RepID=A0ABQ9EZ57_TEGGR|nr:hypothetical protein KUTeg_012310 [Tegillarca granosa]